MVNRIFSLIYLVLFSIKFLRYNGKCTNGMPYKKSDICGNVCNADDLIVDKTCIPVSTSKDHIEEMISLIKSYIGNPTTPITSNIVIEGEGINYQITRSNLIANQNNANNIINLNIEDKCLNKIKNINTDFYVILINIINSNYTTSKNGMIIISSNQELSSNICEGETISFGIPISVPQETLTTYKSIHDNYNFDIFNLNSSFYTDICETFTTKDKTDMSLSLRKEIYGSHGVDVCAQNCEYKKYDIGANKIYCECLINTGSENNKNNKNLGQKIYDGIADFLDLLNLDVMLCTKIVYSSGAKGLLKNYGFMVMTIVSFLYILIIIISLCIFSKLITKKVDTFNDLENKFKTILEKENNNNNNIENENEPQNSNEKILKLNNDQNDPKENKEDKKLEEEEEEDDEEEEEEEDDDIEEEKKEVNNNNNNNEQKKINYLNNKNEKNDDDNNNNDIKEEVPKRYDEHRDTQRTSPLRNGEDDIHILDSFNSPSYSYYDYLNYYNNYMKYMSQQQQFYQNMNNQQQAQPQNNFNQLKDDDVIKIQIPYEQILENIKKAKQKMKKKKGKSKDKNHKRRKKSKKPENNEENENEFENPKRVIRKPKKSKKSKNKTKKDKKPIQFELKLVDILKPNPPKKAKIPNNNNELVSSQNRGLNLNNNDNTKRDDNSVYNLYNRQNKKYLSNKSLKSNNSAISNKNNATVLTNKQDDEHKSDDKNNINRKEKEKDIVNEENNKDNTKQSDFKFGSTEFYEKLLKIKEEERMQFFIDEELNDLEYKYAIEIDKRSFFKIYMSILVKQNVLIFCVLYCTEDYNLSIIKFTFLMFQFIIYITVSALFFTDNTLNNNYKKKNKFDFPFMIRQLAFTFLICLGINIIFKLLVKTDDNIIDIKYGKKQFDEAKCRVKCKFIFYLIFSIIIIILGWFYISCFCAVYSNTQIILIKCAGYSLAISFIYPFFTSLLSSSFRKCALNSKNKDKKCLFEFSKILEYFI